MPTLSYKSHRDWRQRGRLYREDRVDRASQHESAENTQESAKKKQNYHNFINTIVCTKSIHILKHLKVNYLMIVRVSENLTYYASFRLSDYSILSEICLNTTFLVWQQHIHVNMIFVLFSLKVVHYIRLIRTYYKVNNKIITKSRNQSISIDLLCLKRENPYFILI